MWGIGLGSIFLLAVSASLSCCDGLSSPLGLAGSENGGKIVGSSQDLISYQAGNTKTRSTHSSTDISFREEFQAADDHKIVQAPQ